MKKEAFLAEIARIAGSESQTLSGQETLEALLGWDSMAVVEFQAFVDSEFEVQLPPDQIANCKTVDDLVVLLGTRISF